MLAVIDTNVLVSAVLSDRGAPSKIMQMVTNDIITPCYDNRILSEYCDVLMRPKFGFNEYRVSGLLNMVINKGINYTVRVLDVDFIDKDDKKFYEVAKFSNAVIITGNIKHFPREDMIMTPGEFLEKYNL